MERVLYQSVRLMSGLKAFLDMALITEITQREASGYFQLIESSLR